MQKLYFFLFLIGFLLVQLCQANNRTLEENFPNEVEKTLQAQLQNNLQPADSTPKRVSHVLRWISYFMTYSGYEASENFNLQKLLGQLAGEGGVQALSFNVDLDLMLDEFQRDHYYSIYPVPVYNINNGTFNRFNQLAVTYSNPRSRPYANLYIYLDTLAGGKFKLSFKLQDHQDGEDFTSIDQALNAALDGKTFGKIGDSRDPVNAAIGRGLEMVGQQIGDRYFPALAVFHRDRYYGNDHLLELWQDEGPVRLKAVDKNQNPVYAGWSGPNVESMGDSAFYNTSAFGPYSLGVHRTYQAPDPDNAGQTMQQTDSIVVKVVVKQGTGIPDIGDIVKVLLKEALNAQREKVLAEMEKLNEELEQENNTLGEQIAKLEKGNLALEADGQTFQPLFDEPVLVKNETLFNNSEERKKASSYYAFAKTYSTSYYSSSTSKPSSIWL